MTRETREKMVSPDLKVTWVLKATRVRVGPSDREEKMAPKAPKAARALPATQAPTALPERRGSWELLACLGTRAGWDPRDLWGSSVWPELKERKEPGEKPASWARTEAGEHRVHVESAAKEGSKESQAPRATPGQMVRPGHRAKGDLLVRKGPLASLDPRDLRAPPAKMDHRGIRDSEERSVSKARLEWLDLPAWSGLRALRGRRGPWVSEATRARRAPRASSACPAPTARRGPRETRGPWAARGRRAPQGCEASRARGDCRAPWESRD